MAVFNDSDPANTSSNGGDEDLIGANLTRANLTSANFNGADFFRANLTGATVTGADINGALTVDWNISGAVGSFL